MGSFIILLSAVANLERLVLTICPGLASDKNKAEQARSDGKRSSDRV